MFEHVTEPRLAAVEIFRVLRLDGIFVASMPNPRAPEFQVAKRTPLWFHRRVRNEQAWETLYNYGSVDEIIDIFTGAGFVLEGVEHYPFMRGYLGSYPVLDLLGRLYDGIVSLSGFRRFMGDVCAAFRKPSSVRGACRSVGR